MNKFFHELTRSADGEVFFIAEACDNHMGSLEYAKSLAKAAKWAGADAVKFQHHLPAEEMLRECEMTDNFDDHLFDFLEANSLSLEDHIKLKAFCDEIQILYLCTPFSWLAAQEIAELVPFFKIGSGEFADYWFIDQLVSLQKPVLFSSGMCIEEEIDANVKHYKEIGLEFAILNCLSEYPPENRDLNLGYVQKLCEKFPNIVIGHSDHTPDIWSSIIAISAGAKIIEKHLTLSRFVAGPDASVSISPAQLGSLIQAGRQINCAIGIEKAIRGREIGVRKWAYRSLVLRRAKKVGERIEAKDICSKRPGTGIPAKDYESVIGMYLLADHEKDSILTYDTLSQDVPSL